MYKFFLPNEIIWFKLIGSERKKIWKKQELENTQI